MPKLSTIILFQEVVRSGSFSEAARKIGVPPSTVSRLVGSLEAELETQLFHRSTRQLQLTDVGQHYYNRIAPLVAEMTGIHQELADFDREPRGLLRVTAPTEFTRVLLAPLLSSYFAEFPSIRVEVVVRDEYIDLIKEGIDLAIRFGELRDTSLIARKLAEDPAILCASETYISAHGMPEFPSDLSTHNCLQFEPPGEMRNTALTQSLWRFSHMGNEFEVPVRGNIIANSVAPLVAAALEGLGIVIAPKWSVRGHIDHRDLIEVLPNYKVGWDASERAIYAVYPPTRYLPLKIRSFVDFLARELKPPSV